MRKISVGSFPLIEVSAENRKFIDSYLINILSDLITVNQLSASIYDDRAKFIAPTVILDYFKKNSKDLNFDKGLSGDTETNSRDAKAKVIKNAFKNTKNLYRSISNDPFFKNQIFYPIYIEEGIKGKGTGDNAYSDYKYDFLILSNDLIKKQILDEVRFDDNLTMLFLVLKDILYPRESLTDLGKNKSINMKKYFSVYLETAKNEGINPFDLFIKIIKKAGEEKMSGNSRITSGKLFNQISGVTESRMHAKAFLKLFNSDGEIKDVDFLLNLTQGGIADFVDETSKTNSKASSSFNSMTRQYAQAKTHEYSKILSIIDALTHFNAQENVTEEINDNKMVQLLKIKDKDGSEKDLPVNVDNILNDLEVIYYKNFLDGIVKKDTVIINDVLRTIQKDKNITADFIEDIDKDKVARDELANILREKGIQQNEVKTANKNYAQKEEAYNHGTINEPEFAKAYADQEAAQRKLTEIEQSESRIRQDLIFSAQLDSFTQNVPKNKLTDKHKLIQATVGIDLELYKAHLTALYSELYTYFYSNEFFETLTNINYNIDDFTKNSGKNSAQIKMAINNLDNVFKDHYTNAIIKFIDDEIFQKYTNSERYDFNKLKTELKAHIEASFDSETGTLANIWKTIINPVHVKYSNPTMMESERIKNLRAEKNPLLRTLLSNRGMFKSFILNEETALGVYEVLHYLDTLKYQVGLINHPVSNVSNKINKINFLINRFGLGGNPVFVIGSSTVTLSMPDHLSLSGKNFINEIPMNNFMRVAAINYDKELWSQRSMFGGEGANSISGKKRAADLRKIEKDIKDAQISFKVAVSKKNKVNQNKQTKILADLKKKKELAQAQNNEANSFNSNNFSGNLNPNMRDSRDRDWDGRSQSRPYDQNMDQNGNYREDNSRVNNTRNNMENLSRQNFETDRRINPRNNFNAGNTEIPQDSRDQNYSPGKPRTNFMNNQNIQNRYQQVNPNQNQNPNFRR